MNKKKHPITAVGSNTKKRMNDTIYVKQGDSLTIIAKQTMSEPQIFNFWKFWLNYYHFIIIAIWIILSFIIVYLVKNKLKKELFIQGRIMIYYFILSSLVVLLFVGEKFEFLKDYSSGIITELIGIGFTVFIIDTIISYIGKKQEELYRALALKNSKMPIYTYCSIWISIYKSNANNKSIADFSNTKDFFLSDEFYDAITSYDFNQLIAPNKSQGTYYNDTVLKISDKFQNILAKYASKLSIKDLKLIEHFGGSAYFYKIFVVNKFLTEVNYSTSITNATGVTTQTTITRPFINSFRDLTKNNFQKHFITLLDLIDNYNEVTDNKYDEWDLNSLTSLETISKMNSNENVQW